MKNQKSKTTKNAPVTVNQAMLKPEEVVLREDGNYPVTRPQTGSRQTAT